MSEIERPELRAAVDEILNRRPAVGLAVGVVRDGTLEFFHGHGVADIPSNRPVTEDTIFRIASITKTFTAIAVMQLWERGLVDLDAPAADYLRAFRLVPARSGWRPATVRHLLTHTAGLGEVAPASGALRPNFGENIEPGRPRSLAEHYRGRLRIDAEPGTRFRYGNHSHATLGQMVEDMTGQPLHRYLREHVFEPLGMTSTSLVRADLDAARIATGYTLRSSGPRAVPEREPVTAGAGAAYSTPTDMARYVAALLGGGANEHGSVLEPATLATMFAPQYQADPRLPGVGLTFFRGDVGGHHVAEHQGILPGFNSQITVAPGDGVGILAFTNGAHRAVMWLPVETGTLLGSVLGVPGEKIRTDIPQRPEVWSEICGWYYLPGRLTDTRVRAMIGAGVEVFVRRGELLLRFLTPLPPLYRGLPLHPDDPADPYAFRFDLGDGLGSSRVVFGREPGTDDMSVHFELMPLSARKRPPATNPRLWTEGAGAVAAATLLVRRVARGRGHSPAP
ncbi:serine hydrolase domain-containing protein [Rhodococcus aetherivorans]|uniref:serine hydrolase domain-containing protein n=1 Tax=Rhodococcus aetherivorans TaxID=191292 RepID=UPI0002D2313A|nr:serine hydrolase domain-containing protein [Rhodococcus aetherivorans]CCW12857.1 beta-lactamase [Rhodococcus aetherivorans]